MVGVGMQRPEDTFSSRGELGGSAGGEEVVEETGDGEGADTAFFWGDGGEVFASAKFTGKIAF